MSVEVLKLYLQEAATFSRIPEIPRCELWEVGSVSCVCLWIRRRKYGRVCLGGPSIWQPR